MIAVKCLLSSLHIPVLLLLWLAASFALLPYAKYGCHLTLHRDILPHYTVRGKVNKKRNSFLKSQLSEMAQQYVREALELPQGILWECKAGKWAASWTPIDRLFNSHLT